MPKPQPVARNRDRIPRSTDMDGKHGYAMPKAKSKNMTVRKTLKMNSMLKFPALIARNLDTRSATFNCGFMNKQGNHWIKF